MKEKSLDWTQKMESIWGKGNPIHIIESPARINIIGEHVDYLGGLVLPAAIHFSTFLAIRANSEGKIRLHSIHFNESLELSSPEVQTEKKWANYILGVVEELKKSGQKIDGFDLIVDGNIPQGAGLSSSASLEVGVGYGLSRIFNLSLSRPELAILGQKAENNFVGTQCGIMDQFIIAVGQKDKAILLNTETLEFNYHSIHLENAEFYLINSHVKHSLETSSYNDRRKEAESAFQKILKLQPGIKNLYSTPEDGFDPDLYSFTENEKKRVMHVLGEKERTQKILKAFREGDEIAAGKALGESHVSLSELYEVSCPETDFLVKELSSEGVLGARMIGGGFGGCILVLDKIGNYEKVKSNVLEKYFQKFSIRAEFFPFQISDGVREIVNSEV